MSNIFMHNIEDIFSYLGIEEEYYKEYENDKAFMCELCNVHYVAKCAGMEYCLRGDEFRFDTMVIIKTDNFAIFKER